MIVVSSNAGKKVANINKVGSSSGQQNVTLQESLRLAVQYHIAGDLSEAESIYRQILQTDPNQPKSTVFGRFTRAEAHRNRHPGMFDDSCAPSVL